eukprot:scaffold2448_cov155-Amphora_coffeaeformis.AAC.14
MRLGRSAPSHLGLVHTEFRVEKHSEGHRSSTLFTTFERHMRRRLHRWFRYVEQLVMSIGSDRGDE